ncbi:MAG: hypothetical protein ACKV2T_28075 [Kofleriaceae bacterium]
MRCVLLVVLAACYREAPSREAPSLAAPSLAAPSPPDLSRAARAIIASLDSGDVGSIATYLDADIITIESSCPVCDDPEGTGVVSTPSIGVLTRAAFIAFVQDAELRLERGPYSFHAPVRLTCDDSCCTGPTGPLVPNQLYVTRVCFRPGAKLASIAYLDAG